MTSKFITLVFILILGAPALKAQDSISLKKDTVVSPLRKANLFVQNKIGAPIKKFTKQMTHLWGR